MGKIAKPITISQDDTLRFFSKIRMCKESKCWEWGAGKTNKGYGFFSMNRSVFRAHRISYHVFKGELDSNLVIDHICRNRACVNPDHLRQVTTKTNVTENSKSLTAIHKAKTHCKRGHEFTPENTYMEKKGRGCRACGRERSLAYLYKKRNKI